MAETSVSNYINKWTSPITRHSAQITTPPLICVEFQMIALIKIYAEMTRCAHRHRHNQHVNRYIGRDYSVGVECVMRDWRSIKTEQTAPRLDAWTKLTVLGVWSSASLHSIDTNWWWYTMPVARCATSEAYCIWLVVSSMRAIMQCSRVYYKLVISFAWCFAEKQECFQMISN